MSEKEKILQELALAIEDIIVTQEKLPPEKRIWGNNKT